MELSMIANTRNIMPKTYSVIAIALAIVFVAFFAFAWTGPSSNPPVGNVFTPVNLTGTGQVKSGGLWASAIGSDSGYCIGGSCISVWRTDPWTSLGTNLYYNGGNVGIGTAAPVTKLDVNGYMRLVAQSSAPLTCNATYDGTIALNSAGWICICNGSAWIADATGAACSWNPDTTPPTVSITAPSNGATVAGTIAVNATASDNVGVVGVQFKLDGVNLGAEDTTAPYSISWGTTSATNGAHTLTAVARDAAGNQTTSAVVNVTVSNSSPGSHNYSWAGLFNFTVPAYTSLTVEVWGAGGGGGSGYYFGSNDGAGGGTSSFGTVSASGGGGGGRGVTDGNYTSPGSGGSGSGGTTNLIGQSGGSMTYADGCYASGAGGDAAGGGGAGSAGSIGCILSYTPGGNGGAPGGGGAGGGGVFADGLGGGGGGYSTRTYTPGQLTVGSTISVTVGAGGVGGASGVAGGAGAAGRVYITWY